MRRKAMRKQQAAEEDQEEEVLRLDEKLLLLPALDTASEAGQAEAVSVEIAVVGLLHLSALAK